MDTNLTKHPTLIIGATPLPPDSEAEIHRIIDLWRGAQEQDRVARQCDGHYHFHSRGDRLQRFHFHAVKPGIWLVSVLIGEQAAYALVAERRPAIGGEVPLSDRSGDALSVEVADHGSDGIAAFRRQQGADDFHDPFLPVFIHEGSANYGLRNEITWPRGLPTAPIRWSPLAGRKCIVHPDPDSRKEV